MGAGGPPPPEDRDAFELKTFFHFGLDAEPSIFLGPKAFGFKLYDTRAGLKFDLAIDEPFDPLHPDYQGPNWALNYGGDIRWNTSLGSSIQKFMDVWLPGMIFGGVNLAQPIFEEFEPLWTSPNLSLLSKCEPMCPMAWEAGDYLFWNASTSDLSYDSGRGRTELIGWQDGNTGGEILATDESLSNGNATGQWMPGNLDEGQWDLDALLWDIDFISKWKPYKSTGMHEAAVVPGFTLTLEKAGLGTGNVTGSRDINCGETKCTQIFGEGEQITLTATEVYGNVFDKWTGLPGCELERECVTTLNADTTATAYFAQGKTLVVNKAGDGVGRIFSLPEGIDCGWSYRPPTISGGPTISNCPDQSEIFKVDSEVRLTAEGIAPSVFVRWVTGCPGSTNPVCDISMDPLAQVEATAEFTGFDEQFEQHLVGVWDVYEDFWAYAEGPPGTRTCADPESYVQVGDITAHIYRSKTPQKRIELFADGTATQRYFNWDGVSERCSYDSYVLDPPPGQSTRWRVDNGRFYYASYYSIVNITGTITQLAEQYEEHQFFRKDYFYPNEYGSRFRMYRVNSP